MAIVKGNDDDDDDDDEILLFILALWTWQNDANFWSKIEQTKTNKQNRNSNILDWLAEWKLIWFN